MGRARERLRVVTNLECGCVRVLTRPSVLLLLLVLTCAECAELTALSERRLTIRQLVVMVLRLELVSRLWQ